MLKFAIDFQEKSKERYIINRTSRKEVIDSIGGWRDLNSDEDNELFARAISNGVHVVWVPAFTEQNSLAKHRGMRYFKGKYISYILRELRWHMDRVRGNGSSSIRKILLHRIDQVMIDLLSVVAVKARNEPFYDYSSKMNNLNYVLQNTEFTILPEDFPEAEYIILYYKPTLLKRTLEKLSERLREVGLTENTDFMGSIIFHNVKVDPVLLKRAKNYIAGSAE